MNRWTLALASALCLAGVTIASAGITTFSDGDEGWRIFNQDAYVSPTGGNPGYALESGTTESYNPSFSNSTNPAFLGDLTDDGSLCLTIDVRVNAMCWVYTDGTIGLVSRDFFVEFKDVVSYEPYEAVSVKARIGRLDPSLSGWHTYSIEIADPTATELPEGWQCFQGAVEGEWELPEGRTFASVLQNVDEVCFDTEAPGYMQSAVFCDFDIDNVGYVSIPEPTTLSLLGLGAFGLLRRRH